MVKQGFIREAESLMNKHREDLMPLYHFLYKYYCETTATTTNRYMLLFEFFADNDKKLFHNVLIMNLGVYAMWRFIRCCCSSNESEKYTAALTAMRVYINKVVPYPNHKIEDKNSLNANLGIRLMLILHTATTSPSGYRTFSISTLIDAWISQSMQTLLGLKVSGHQFIFKALHEEHIEYPSLSDYTLGFLYYPVMGILDLLAHADPKVLKSYRNTLVTKQIVTNMKAKEIELLINERKKEGDKSYIIPPNATDSIVCLLNKSDLNYIIDAIVRTFMALEKDIMHDNDASNVPKSNNNILTEPEESLQTRLQRPHVKNMITQLAKKMPEAIPTISSPNEQEEPGPTEETEVTQDMEGKEDEQDGGDDEKEEPMPKEPAAHLTVYDEKTPQRLNKPTPRDLSTLSIIPSAPTSTDFDAEPSTKNINTLNNKKRERSDEEILESLVELANISVLKHKRLQTKVNELTSRLDLQTQERQSILDRLQNFIDSFRGSTHQTNQ